MRVCRPRWLLMLGMVCAAFAANAATGPLTVTFDDIDASLADTPIVSPYQGLGWTNITAYAAALGFTGFNNGIVSGPTAAYSGGENAGPGVTPIVGSITALSGQVFDFLGASFGAGYYNNLSLTVTGSFQGTVIGTRTLTLATTGAQAYYDFTFAGLDTLTFTALRTTASTDPFACGIFDCTQFTMDDARFVVNDLSGPPSPPPIPPIVSDYPEPATTALLAAGLGVLALHRRSGSRRRRPGILL